MIYGERVKQARELRGITQTDLAKVLSVTQPYIAQVEGNLMQPSDEKLMAIALVTGFPLAFFRQQPPPDFPIGSLLYRARASATAAEKTRARRFGQLTYELAAWFAARVTDLPVNIPRIAIHPVDAEASTDPTHAAQITRATLGLSPDTPMDNLIRTIEQAGVFVLAIPTEMGRIDAFSMWVNADGERPVIVITAQTAGDRLRLSTAHELGHLVMHHAPSGSIKQIEQEAFQFAAEFLMPEQAMREEITSPVTLTSLAKLKPRWRVSIQALIRRARDLEIISEYQYRYLFEQLGAFGWRTREPANLDIPVEKPRFIRQVAEMLYQRPLDYQRIASDLFLPATLTEEILGTQAGEAQMKEDNQSENNEDEGGNGSGPMNIVPFTLRR